MRKSTRTISWTNGNKRTKPGPLTFWKRPSVKTTARSYSRKIFTVDVAKMKATTTTIGAMTYRVEKYMLFRLSKRENELLLAAKEVKLPTGSTRTGRRRQSE